MLLFTIILPIKFNIFVNRKHNEHIIVDAGPNWRTGNCYKLSYIRIIVTVVIEDCEIRHNIYGKYVSFIFIYLYIDILLYNIGRYILYCLKFL